MILRPVKGITLFEHGANRGSRAVLQTGMKFSPNNWVVIVGANATCPLRIFPDS